MRRTVWPQLVSELEQMDAAPIRALRLIQRQLRDGSYEFSPKWGYAKRKSGGSRRGITVHGIKDRVIQRSILNIIHSSDPEIQRYLGDVPEVLRTPTTFAAAPGRGVPDAVALVYKTLRTGARVFAYSDVKDFFPCVPRHEVVTFLKSSIDDQPFLELFEAALKTEIDNRSDIDRWLALFPIYEIGVAQGSLLSALVGNLALRHFDARLNNNGLTTVRYLDDFAILGPDRDRVSNGFCEAQSELARLGMSCYEPNDGSQKAFLGYADNGFDFLGCHIHPDGVSPARRAQRKLLRDVSATIAKGKAQIRNLRANPSRRRTEFAYAQTLVQIDRTVRGWGDAYRFVSNRLPFSQMDIELDRLLDDFQHWFRRNVGQAETRTKRRMQGIALLADTPN